MPNKGRPEDERCLLQRRSRLEELALRICLVGTVNLQRPPTHAASPPSQSTRRACRMTDPDDLSWIAYPSNEVPSLALAI